jgi:hypothetical protein
MLILTQFFLPYSEQSLYVMHGLQKYTKHAKLRSSSRRFLYSHFEYNNNEMKNTHISLIFRNLDPEQNSSSVKEVHYSKINIMWNSDKTICCQGTFKPKMYSLLSFNELEDFISPSFCYLVHYGKYSEMKDINSQNRMVLDIFDNGREENFYSRGHFFYVNYPQESKKLTR